MKAFGDDLRFAQHAGVAVRVRTMSGQEFLAVAHEVHEHEGYVSLYVPEHMGDDTTRRIHVTIPDVQGAHWSYGRTDDRWATYEGVLRSEGRWPVDA